ncbi:hydantoinase B/oxoprolinase family protein [Nitrospirillum viridazoti]|uniref:N-methylhydantoinase B n=2 Tax=Nitrospirillum TaxID=1543705 RepID=A0A560IYM0_9PROT|nr:hydantoinase B/oxoprolinase family protein [Nitrospirillum amazonense]TWB63937.1 N-methylhydantoinase B [Nitrospirillum amazonense]
MIDSEINPITLEIWWSRLIAIADEAAATLLRTSFSTVIRESNDYVTVLMDADGETIGECTLGIPAFAALVGRATRAMLDRFPASTWREGDVVMTNDPWIGTGHLPDIVVVAPIFHHGVLVGFSGSAAHAPDIGGTFKEGPTELIEEGVLIPPVRLYRTGELNDDLVQLLLANIRLKDIVFGDIEAQVNANEVCRRRAVEFLEDTGEPDFKRLGRAVTGLAERAMRAAIAGLPDGVYRGAIEADGVGDQPTRIACAVTIAGDDITVDYDGSSPQVAYAINSTLNYTRAYTIYPLKCLLDPFTRRNEGSYRPIRVTAPAGTILNPTAPAPVMARHLTGHLLSCALFQALSPLMPERVVADSGGAPALRAHFSGRTADGGRFGQLLFASAGMGASAERDGLSTTAFPTNSGAGSVEAMETVSPLLFLRKAFRPDSGGAGRQRGGLGQDCEILNAAATPIQMVLLGDRERHPALGIMGGGSGAPALAAHRDGRTVPMKSRSLIQPGESVTLSFPGGGGYGPPADRPVAAIETDLKRGVVTTDAVRRDYPTQALALGLK